MSVTTASGRQVLKISSPRVPMRAVRTSKPACSSRIFSHSVIAGSSSIASTRLLRFKLMKAEFVSNLRPKSIHNAAKTLANPTCVSANTDEMAGYPC